MSQPQGLYPYFEQEEEYTFPGEMPAPTPVGYTDPGISSLKANADHSHAPATDTGTVVQERAMSFVGQWGAGNLNAAGNPFKLGVLPLLPIGKRFGGTTLRITIGASCWNVGPGTGIIYIQVSPTNSAGDLVFTTVFGFSTVNVHQHFTGMIDIPNRGAADYNLTFWGSGPVVMNSDANDVFWGKVAEVWP